MRTLQFCKGVAKSLKMLFHVFKIMSNIVINKRVNSQKFKSVLGCAICKKKKA